MSRYPSFVVLYGILLTPHLLPVSSFIWGDKTKSTIPPTTTTTTPTTTTPFHDCGGNLTIQWHFGLEPNDQKGTIESPNFPQKYLAKSECTWRIFIQNQPIGTVVKIDFSNDHKIFALSPDATLNIINKQHNGQRKDYSVKSGNSVPEPIILEDSVEVRVSFESGSRAADGFQITVALSLDDESLCGGTRNINLPHSPYNTYIPEKLSLPANGPGQGRVDVKCAWYLNIKDETNDKIHLYLTKMNIAHSTEFIIYDGLTIKDGKRMEIFPAGIDYDQKLTSKSNSMTIVWKSENTKTDQTFNAYISYSAIVDKCGDVIISSSQPCNTGPCHLGQISATFNKITTCLWYVISPNEEQVISAQRFQVPDSYPTGWTAKVFSGIGQNMDKHLVDFYHQAQPFDLTINENAMTVEFDANYNFGRGPFVVDLYSQNRNSTSDRIINDSPRGLIMSPSYPNLAKSTQSAQRITWHLQNDMQLSESQIKLEFGNTVNIGPDDYIRIYDGDEKSFFSAQAGATIKSCSNELKIDMVLNDADRYKGFKAIYEQVSNDCSRKSNSAPEDHGFPAGGIIAICVVAAILLIILVFAIIGILMKQKRINFARRTTSSRPPPPVISANVRQTQEDVETGPQEENEEGEYVTENNWPQISAAFPPPPSYRDAINSPKFEMSPEPTAPAIGENETIERLNEVNNVT